MAQMPDVDMAAVATVEAEGRLRVALDNMPGGLVYTDQDLNVVFCNDRFKQMYAVPSELLEPGRPYVGLLRHLAENGYYGAGDVEAQVAQRIESLRNPSGKSLEDHTPDGRWYRVLRSRVALGGTVSVVTDITEQKQAELQLAAKEAEFHVALDNMPGTLVYTDRDINVVFCNDRFRQMYAVPPALLERGRPYADLLRYLAEHGYYGAGDVEAQVARRIESLRNPTGKTLEDHTPDGRWYRVVRSRVALGGTVSVTTDVTEQKQAELRLAAKEAELHVALDNMPGALVYTDAELKIVFCNDRYRELYIVPAELLQPGRPYTDLLRYLAENGYYGEGDVEAQVAHRVESLRNPTGKSLEDHAPDGRWYRVRRSRVARGGTVTVITDITEQKHAERDLLEATRRTEEANRLITEKNRVLEGLYQEIRDKNGQLEEQAAQIAEWNARLETRVTEQVAQIGQMSKLTRFLSPKVSDLIMSGDADDPLKTRRREITVVFVDLRGFTGFTETAEPEEVMSVLREYHAELGREIMEFDGTIEHFAGDGVMILFNAPLPVEDHELRAIRMALRMREAIAVLAQGWKKHGYALGFGVGIAGGYATIGTIGFEGRFDYGAIGTVTNLAARLCGEAADGQILVSPRIFTKTETLIDASAVGELTLKGFQRPVAAYNVLGLRAA
ncbi:MAG: PAS-domain containing protein [Betaproteobacteria bacterium]|nr:PAS-domain containing protein [Betaproteobacteria bacterium]